MMYFDEEVAKTPEGEEATPAEDGESQAEGTAEGAPATEEDKKSEE